jgi:hypothetical protein
MLSKQQVQELQTMVQWLEEKLNPKVKNSWDTGWK